MTAAFSWQNMEASFLYQRVHFLHQTRLSFQNFEGSKIIITPSANSSPSYCFFSDFLSPGAGVSTVYEGFPAEGALVRGGKGIVITLSS
jgi:hypothetical protein